MQHSKRTHLVCALVVALPVLALTTACERRPQAPVDELEAVGQTEPPTPAPIIDVTDATFAAEVLDAAMPVVVFYWAAWAGPTKRMAPLVYQLASDYAGTLKVVRLDVDASPKTQEQYGVREVPVLGLFSDGQLVATLVGLVTRDRIDAWLETELQK